MRCKITDSDQLINDMSEGTRTHLWEKHIKNEIYLQSHNVFPLICLTLAAVDVFPSMTIYRKLQPPDIPKVASKC